MIVTRLVSKKSKLVESEVRRNEGIGA